MKKFIIIFCFIMFNCNRHVCSDSLQYKNLKDFYNSINIQKSRGSGEVEFKSELLANICEYIADNDKILFVEEVDQFGQQRTGLIYLYANDKYIYYEKNRSEKIKIGAGDNNNVALKKVVSYLKKDFKLGIDSIKRIFEDIAMNDVPHFQMYLLDSSNKLEGTNFFEFSFSPDYLLHQKQ